MKVVKRALSQFEFEKLIKSINFSGCREKVISLGGNLSIRAYQTGKIVFFHRSSGTRHYTRIGVYKDEYTYAQALMYSKQLSSNLYIPLLKNQFLSVSETKEIFAPKFSDVAYEWLESKRELARYANYRKCVEYLSFLYDFNVNEIKNTFVKKNLLNLDIRPYKLKETLSVLCRIMDLAVQNEYIEHHHMNLLLKADCFPRPSQITDGYKFVEIDELSKHLVSIDLLLDKSLVLYFMLLILTCLRPGECRQLKYEYFDLEKKILNVPGSIMKIKTAKPFRIPLTPELINLYRHIKDYLYDDTSNNSDYIFQAKRSKKPLAERDISCALKMVSQGQLQPHGFRKTARSFFAEAEINLEVAAMCLAHKLNTGADSVYQKSDLLKQRRAALEKYHQAVYNVSPDGIKSLLNQ